MTRPLITIVIPVHNRAKIIGRTLLSVSGQTCRDFKVVVVDNASTDATASVIEQWVQSPECRDIDITVVAEPKPGACAARNAGLALVDTPWTMFFDSDDTMAPDHVQRAIRAIGQHPEASVVGWDIRLHRLDGRTEVKPFADRNVAFNCLIHGTMATQRYMARTELFKSVGGWCESLPVWNDIEFGTRLLVALFKAGHLRTTIVRLSGKPTVDVYATEVSISGTGYTHNAPGRALSVDRIAEIARAESEVVPMKWVALKRMTLAATCSAEPDHDPAFVKEQAEKALAEAGNARRRLVLKALYRYIHCGWSGASRIFGRML